MSLIDFEHKFFGRENVLSLLKKRIIDLKEGYRQNVALLGNQYVGKSSILHNFISNLDEENIITIYLDLENKDFNYFFSKFMGSLLYNYSKSQKLQLHDDLNLLIENTKDHLPNTIQIVRKILCDIEKGKISDAFLGLLALPEVFTNETDTLCLMVFDEFQNLENYGIEDVFQTLGKKIMTQKKCLYILSSSYKVIAQRILSEKLSLLFGNFEVISVEAFNLQESQNFIENCLRDIKIGAQLRNFLTDFTGGHPLYLNLISQELINLSSIHRQNEIYMPILSQSIENTIFNKWGVLSRHFELIAKDICSGKGNQIISSMLIALSNGRHKIDQLIEDVGIKKNMANQKMTRLLELGIIVKNGNFHYYKDKLFKYWIKYVYQKRLRDVELAPDKQRKQFKEELHRSVEEFKLSSRKDFPSRIMELIYCFDNESFNLNGRKYRLPNFKDAESIKIRNENGISVDMIRAKTDEASWFIVTKKDNVGEGDVNTVLTEAKRQEKKPERCLIISLTDLDENTKIRALQEKFWVWNETELKDLLTLFDKPYIL